MIEFFVFLLSITWVTDGEFGDQQFFVLDNKVAVDNHFSRLSRP